MRIDERDLPDETEGGLEFIMDGATGRFAPTDSFSITPQTRIKLSVEEGKPKEILVYMKGRDDWVATEDIKSACDLRSDNSLRKHLKALVREGHLDERGEGTRGHPKEYKIV
jgi:hypothetical protein